MSESPRQAIDSIIGQLIADVTVTAVNSERTYLRDYDTRLTADLDKLRFICLTRIMSIHSSDLQGRRSGTKDRRAN